MADTSVTHHHELHGEHHNVHHHPAASHSVHHELPHDKVTHEKTKRYPAEPKPVAKPEPAKLVEIPVVLKQPQLIYEERNLEVIGAGFGRTGTSSLKEALEILGYIDTYHMSEVFGNSDQRFWSKVADRKVKIDFNEVLKKNGRNYTATCDFPSAVYWREQLAQFPDAKVILSVRDPEKWYKSCCDTIFNVMPYYPKRMFGAWFRRLFSTLGTEEMMGKVISRDAFHNDYSKAAVLKSFNDHNAAVIAECPKEKLLVFEVSQGWEPLCKFLGKPVPSVPFPNVNDTVEFRKLIEFYNNTGYAIIRNWVISGLMLGVALLKNHSV